MRLGTAEFYRVVEELPEVADSWSCTWRTRPAATATWFLFVTLAGGGELTDDLVARMRRELRTALSPRHVPDRVVPVRPSRAT